MRLRLGLVRRSRVSSTARIGPLARVRDSQLAAGVSVGALSIVEHSTVGEHSYIGHNSTLKRVTVGKFSSVAWNVSILGVGAHPTHHLTTHPFPYNSVHGFVATDRLDVEIKETVVGHDCWIGAHAVVLPGVRVANGAVVGAGSVVTQNVPAYAIVAGVPAVVQRLRFSPAIIAEVEGLAWWDWSEAEIARLAHHFSVPADGTLVDSLRRQRDS